MTQASFDVDTSEDINDDGYCSSYFTSHLISLDVLELMFKLGYRMPFMIGMYILLDNIFLIADSQGSSRQKLINQHMIQLRPINDTGSSYTLSRTNSTRKSSKNSDTFSHIRLRGLKNELFNGGNASNQILVSDRSIDNIDSS